MNIFVVNAGSSSLKCKLFDAKKFTQKCSAIVDGINQKNCEIRINSEEITHTEKRHITNHTQALQYMLKKLNELNIITDLSEITAVGHRVVHGGEKYQAATKVTQVVLKDLKKLSKLAPLHNPANIEGIKACQKIFKKIPQIAVFDTAFHHSIPEHAYLYAIPYKWYKKHDVRKYGFHGTSHQYVSETAQKYLKKKHAKIISCHIGNGSSITAIKNGKSLDTSMGFTPLEGVPMGTRSGNIDPAIIPYAMKTEKKSAEKMLDLLNHEAGLKGLSEISSDMRILWKKAQKKNKKALRALKVMAYRMAQYIGAYTMLLGGCDALIFTAGIGENAWYIRKAIVDELQALNITLNNRVNKTTEYPDTIVEISHKKSTTKVLVIPTNEEKAIALQAHAYIKKAPLSKK